VDNVIISVRLVQDLHLLVILVRMLIEMKIIIVNAKTHIMIME